MSVRSVAQQPSKGFGARLFAKLKGNDGDEEREENVAPVRKTVVKFADHAAGASSGVAQQLKSVKDAETAAQKARETDSNKNSRQIETSDISAQDVDRWLPDHWLRSQYFDDVVHNKTDFQERAQLMQKYLQEEAVISHNAAVSFKFGFSKAVRMKMEKEALEAQRVAEHEQMKEAARNRLDTTTVFDVRHDIFCSGLPKNQPDFAQKLTLVASNWYQRLAVKPSGSGPSVYQSISFGQAKHTDWGAVLCPKGCNPSNRNSPGFVYMGAIQAGFPHAVGEIHFENGDIYQGEFKGGRLTGCGKYWYRSIDEVTCGDVYEGFFLNSCKSGIGSYTFGTAKARYIGEFVQSSFCGFGIYTSLSEKYQGSFLDDKKHGRGFSTFHPINGSVSESLYVGEFKDGRRHGLGRLNFVNCSTDGFIALMICRYFGEFQSGYMHGVGTLASFDGCKLYGTWHLGHRHGHFLIQRSLAKDCQVILYDTDVPIWSRCMVSSDMLQFQTPSVSVMVKVEELCHEIEADVAEKALYYSDRVKDLTIRLNTDVMDTVKACVEQARFHACQHLLFNTAFGISSDDIKIIRVDGERRNVYLRDYDTFSQGVDDEISAAAAKDTTTTQKLARIVQRLQLSIAQGPEPLRIKRKTKAELQAEASAKAAQDASNDLEIAIYEYLERLRKPEFKLFDKLLLLLTALKKLPAQAKLNADLVIKLASMQPSDADSLRIIEHFFTASAGCNNLDWEGRAYIPSGPLLRGIKRQQKVLINLPTDLFEKVRDILLNLSDEKIAEIALKTCEHVREWAFYCDLAGKQQHSLFRTYVNVKNHFAKRGIHIFPPVGVLPQDEIQFNDKLISEYNAETSNSLSSKSNIKDVNSSEAVGNQWSDTSDSDDSVDFTLQSRRFQPLSFIEMREHSNYNVHLTESEGSNVKMRPGTSSVISDSDSSHGSNEEHLSTHAGKPSYARGKLMQSIKTSRPSHSVGVNHVLKPALAFSPMRAGSATQRAARFRDKSLCSSGSESQ